MKVGPLQPLTPYQASYTPKAWRQIARLSHQDFNRLQSAVRELAERVTAEGPPAGETLRESAASGRDLRRNVLVGEYVVSFSVDAGGRRLEVEEFARSAPRSER